LQRPRAAGLLDFFSKEALALATDGWHHEQEMAMTITTDHLIQADRRFGSIAQASHRADVSKDTIYRWIRARRLTAYRPLPGKLLIDLDELDRLILAAKVVAE
jgi:excisionase family DNA binding protein